MDVPVAGLLSMVRVTRDIQHRRLAEAMLANQRTEQPVHTWELPQAGTGTKAEQTAQDIMSTDLFTVLPNTTVQMVASVMDWRYVRHVPVEDEDGSILRIGLAP